MIWIVVIFTSSSDLLYITGFEVLRLFDSVKSAKGAQTNLRLKQKIEIMKYFGINEATRENTMQGFF